MESVKTWISNTLIYRIGNESQRNEICPVWQRTFPFSSNPGRLTLLEYSNPSSYVAASTTVSDTP